MRVAMYYNNRDVRLEDLPRPQIGPGEILMRTEVCGICGSDVLEWYRIKRAPLVLGHEIAGEVVEVGEGVTRFKPGDRIVAAHHVPCNTCPYCLTGHTTACNTLRSTNFDPGGFSEFVRLPAINVDRGTFLIPEGLSYGLATFHEPLGCVIRANRIAALQPGQSVVVLGAGIAGLVDIHYSRHAAAGKILAVEPVASRRRAALDYGADEALAPQEDAAQCMRSLNQGRLADLVMVCTGAESAQSQALDLVERGGTVLFFAPTSTDVEVKVSINNFFFRNDITLTTSYGAAPLDSWQALQLLPNPNLRFQDMITHRLPLGKTGEGFQLVASAQESLKVLVHPQE
jgi:L-iditol 2-dehydrogenase